MKSPSFEGCALITLTLLIGLTYLTPAQALQDLTLNGPGKQLSFNEPDTGIRFKLVAYNVNQTNKVKSLIKVYKIRLNRTLIQADRRPQLVQVLEFSTPLVDFDLDCTRKYCYLVTITNKNRHNVDLYAWTRTQFDLSQTTSSFSTPHAIRIFSIGLSNFYIAIAQDQLQLYSRNIVPINEDEGLTKFFGCAIIKFTTSNEAYKRQITLKYHQFIPLRFHPLSVEHLVSYEQDNHRLHYLVFSKDPKWQDSSHIQSPTFQWSQFDDLFWPVRLSKAVSFERRLNFKYPILIFPNQNIPSANHTTSNRPPVFQDPSESVEICFSKLQRLLYERDYRTKKLINTINPLWHSITPNGLATTLNQFIPHTNLSSQVVVHGDVVVKGTFVRSPQVTFIGPQAHNLTINQESPEVIDRMLFGANLKLQSLNDKLKHAFFPSINSIFRGPIRFLREIQALKVSFTEGIRNINVHLNNIPFKKLRDDLVILDGDQDIMSKVTFTGKVFADSLEIQGLVNGKYFFRDALDITSNQVQVIELESNNNSLPIALEFNNVITPEIVMNYNSSFNRIRLAEFITRDSRVQSIYGRKSFKSIEARRIDVENSDILLNDVNIARLATQSLKLNSPREQVLLGKSQTFTKSVHVKRLIINNNINHRINISFLIHDSLKTYAVTSQQISGLKRFKSGLSINQLTTDGQLNGIQIDQVFNLNPNRVLYDQAASLNMPPYQLSLNPIVGTFNFLAPVSVLGNLNAALVNEVDLTRSSVRRFSIKGEPNPSQVVRGHKYFLRTLRVNELSVLEDEQLNSISENTYRVLREPAINEFNISAINMVIRDQVNHPPPFYVDTLRLNGNLDLSDYHYMGDNNSISCPLNAVRTRQILASSDNQIIDIPVKVEKLRAHHAIFSNGALNGHSFPQDFVLKSIPNRSNYAGSQIIYGIKKLDNIILGQSLSNIQGFDRSSKSIPIHSNVVLGPESSINRLSYVELQSFINHERQRNFTGETVYQTLSVQGNIFAKRINGYRWPDDVMLKSISGSIGPVPFPHVQRRIYSPVVFLNSSRLHVTNLDLKGPVYLEGLLNHINLTEFGRNSVTYGDKDLVSLGRPLRNKIFAGGLKVVNEIRSSGLIDGIQIDDMFHRVVTIRSNPKNMVVTSPKSFISDVAFDGATNINYLNDMLLTPFLKKLLASEGEQLKIFGRKTITGALRVNRDLDLAGLVNHIDISRFSTNNTYLPVEKYRRNSTRIPSRNTPAPYDFQAVRYHIKRESLPYNQLDTYKVRALAARRPIAIRYESQNYLKAPIELQRTNHQLEEFLANLKSQFVSLRLIQHNINMNVVMGFIRSDRRDISDLHLPDKDDHYLEYSEFPKSFLPLDQLRFAFLKSTTYYMSVGITTDSFGYNTTGVYFSVGGSELRQLFTLPVSSPNSAAFVRIAHQSTVFLLVSQDHDTIFSNQLPQCSLSAPPKLYNPEIFNCGQQDNYGATSGGVHVYLFNALLNSSSLTSAYFDLYQTISLPAVDSFEQFQYGSSTYVVAASRLAGRIYILLLRGYSGFQVASYIDEPMLEGVKVLYTFQRQPILLVFLNNGDRKLMEPVIV